MRGMASIPFGLFLAAIWWILTGGVSSSWMIGIPAIALTILVSRAWQAPTLNQFRPLALGYFVPYFLLHSFRGGVDVAWRACLPHLPISPAMIDYPLRLPTHDSSRTFFVNTLNLLPGTITVEILDDHLRIHLLTESDEVVARLSQLEERVGWLFHHRLPESDLSRFTSTRQPW